MPTKEQLDFLKMLLKDVVDGDMFARKWAGSLMRRYITVEEAEYFRWLIDKPDPPTLRKRASNLRRFIGKLLIEVKGY